MSRTSISDDVTYPKFCELASTEETTFNTFRTNIAYQPILEHVTKNEGQNYLDLVKTNNPELLKNLNKYKTNDNIGAPNKEQYKEGYFSPTTLRYIKVLSDLINEFGSLDGLHIVEIGCGYGGQSKIIMDTFNIDSYTLIDLPSVLGLCKKYLNSFDLPHANIHYKTMDELKGDKYDITISNYAFTECNKEVQSTYINKVLLNSDKGYLTANFINHIFNIDYHSKDELLKIIPGSYVVDETPNTHKDNCIILWK
jgi:putative sugar O-methyltransferase